MAAATTIPVADRVDADVCIIGGGPAGAATAIRLAALGHDVVIVEATRLSSQQIGASLPPGILPMLDVLGVRDLVETAGFVRFTDLLVLWDGSRPEIRHRPGPAGLHVDRARLDPLLLQFVQNSGVRVIRPARADRPRRNDNGRWVTLARGQQTLHEISSDIVVDASGGRRMDIGTRTRLSMPTVALYARWQLHGSAAPEGCVEAGAREWMWCAPLDDGSIVAALFVDAGRIKGSSRETVTRLYAGLIQRSRLLGPRLSRGEHGPVEVCDASSWTAVPSAGPGFVRVGDANIALDPLSSQGVQTAIASALQAAVVVNTMLRRPASTHLAAEFYNARQSERASTHHAMASGFYRQMLGKSDAEFWRSRAAEPVSTRGPATTTALQAEYRIKLAAGAVIRPAPVALGDFIEQRPALHHRAAAGPVAFVAGIELAPLLQKLDDGQTVGSLLEDWGQTHPPAVCSEIVSWLWDNEVIVPIM